jgi:hypothetical protein
MTQGVRAVIGFGVGAAIFIGGATLWQSSRTGSTPGEVLREAADKSEFRADWNMTGDDEGAGCHMIGRVSKDGSIEYWYQHVIPGRDFSRATAEERKAWLIEDLKRDIGEIGIACSAPDPFFRPAYAPPPYCEDCGGGGGCAAYNCPATTQPIGPCTINGSTCTMTFFCCDWPCAGWPPC